MSVTLPRALFERLTADAVARFPHEACGFVVERGGCLELVRVTNVQDQKHAEDPETYPRTAATAYTMGSEAVPVLIGYERGDLAIRAIYHSHPQHDAYFSAEDRKQATLWDEPSYPDAAQIVVSVYDRAVKAVKAFGWDPKQRDFVEISLQVAGG
jgi:[CysO sulfur-carrier protein]-S-L-cysteine hydrolase